MLPVLLLLSLLAAGTGKTSTIAALCACLTSVGKRVRVLAPANAASKRVLESLVAAGHTRAALVLSADYNFDWHQDEYDTHLQRFIVTQKVVDRVRQNARRHHAAQQATKGTATGNAAVVRAAADAANNVAAVVSALDANALCDLHTRDAIVLPPSEWSDAFVDHGGSGGGGGGNGHGIQCVDSGCASVCILTFGSVVNAMNAVSGSGSSSVSSGRSPSWAASVARFVDVASIDTVIVDETSQLWAGFGVELMRHFGRATNFVLVGDEFQLPPHHADQVLGLMCRCPGAAVVECSKHVKRFCH